MFLIRQKQVALNFILLSRFPNGKSINKDEHNEALSEESQKQTIPLPDPDLQPLLWFPRTSEYVSLCVPVHMLEAENWKSISSINIMLSSADYPSVRLTENGYITLWLEWVKSKNPYVTRGTWRSLEIPCSKWDSVPFLIDRDSN